MKALIILIFTILTANCTDKKQKNVAAVQEEAQNPYYSHKDTSHLDIRDGEWKKILSEDVFAVTRNEGTERPFTGKYWDNERRGTYYCAVCGNRLFKSDAKFASSCGWPSFFEPVGDDRVVYKQDSSHGMLRTEVECARCNSHLGHIFDDGPPPTHKRYCMNSVALHFEPEGKTEN